MLKSNDSEGMEIANVVSEDNGENDSPSFQMECSIFMVMWVRLQPLPGNICLKHHHPVGIMAVNLEAT